MDYTKIGDGLGLALVFMPSFAKLWFTVTAAGQFISCRMKKNSIYTSLVMLPPTIIVCFAPFLIFFTSNSNDQEFYQCHFSILFSWESHLFPLELSLFLSGKIMTNSDLL